MKNQNSKNKTTEEKTPQKEKLTIDAELVIPLGELAIYILKKGEDEAVIIDVLYKQSEKVNRVIRTIVWDVLREKKSEAKLKELEFDYTDSDNISHGVAYFKVKLEGTEKALKDIAGEDNLFIHDWEEHQDAN